jgi:ribosomal protein S18 acetylase RimI-like enzyme
MTEDLLLADPGTADPDVRFALYADVRTEELGFELLDPALRTPLLKMQFEAQRRGFRAQFPAAEERLILSDGVPAGWVVVDRSGPGVHCVDIAIGTAARGQGLGTRVLRALQAEAAAGGRPLFLSVRHSNLRAQALYRRLGFRVVDENDTHAQLEWRHS